MKIRPASLADLPDCQAIYAHHVLHGTGSFEDTPPSLEELIMRFTAITGAGFPWLVADDGFAIGGFGYYGQFRARSSYRFTVEDSVYVRDDGLGKGTGKSILAALLAAAQQAGFRQMVGLVGGAENAGSIGVHASLGFYHAGTMRNVGYKFGRWLDVVIMQKEL